MISHAQTPGVAHRAARAAVSLRDMDGHAIRPVTLAQAEALVSADAAYPIVRSDGEWTEVRLKVSLPPNSRRTFFGDSVGRGNPGATYTHNFRGCKTWPH